jgi:hypothetical protein
MPGLKETKMRRNQQMLSFFAGADTFSQSPGSHAGRGSVLCAALVLALTFSTAGCSAVSRVRTALERKPAAPPARVVSRLDSLASAGLPVDTLLLAGEPARLWPSAPGAADEYWLGPASAEVGPLARVQGWRVQLASSEKKQELESLVPGVERELGARVYLENLGTRYCLRVGDFRNREQADSERLRAVSFGFKHAWVVQTLIAPR